jgi:hypothetical protein
MKIRFLKGLYLLLGATLAVPVLLAQDVRPAPAPPETIVVRASTLVSTRTGTTIPNAVVSRPY